VYQLYLFIKSVTLNHTVKCRQAKISFCCCNQQKNFNTTINIYVTLQLAVCYRRHKTSTKLNIYQRFQLYICCSLSSCFCCRQKLQQQRYTTSTECFYTTSAPDKTTYKATTLNTIPTTNQIYFYFARLFLCLNYLEIDYNEYMIRVYNVSRTYFTLVNLS